MNIESWLEKKYGRVRSKAERKADKADVAKHLATYPRRVFPKGHIREYDPDGIYTYRDQNPRFN